MNVKKKFFIIVAQFSNNRGHPVVIKITGGFYVIFKVFYMVYIVDELEFCPPYCWSDLIAVCRLSAQVFAFSWSGAFIFLKISGKVKREKEVN